MQVVRPDLMAQDAAQAPCRHRSDFIRCTFQNLFGHRCPPAISRRALLPSGARSTTRNFTGRWM